MAPVDATAAAKKMSEDSSLSAAGRDAYQLRLASSPRVERIRLAAEALAKTDVDQRRIAIVLLSEGSGALDRLADVPDLYLRFSDPDRSYGRLDNRRRDAAHRSSAARRAASRAAFARRCSTTPIGRSRGSRIHLMTMFGERRGWSRW